MTATNSWNNKSNRQQDSLLTSSRLYSSEQFEGINLWESVQENSSWFMLFTEDRKQVVYFNKTL